MGALESKRWSEIPPETPQKSVLPDDGMVDPRSPTYQYNRTPILLQEYDESPQNITLKSEFRDPRSPSHEISRTPFNVSKTSSVNEDVFETQVDGITNPAFSSCSSKKEPQSSGYPTLNKERACLKKTTSPSDFKRRNRLSRRQSLPQKLFTDKEKTPLPRSPLAQRNHSMPEDSHISGKNRKFTFVPKRKGYIAQHSDVDKENSLQQVLL